MFSFDLKPPPTTGNQELEQESIYSGQVCQESSKKLEIVQTVDGSKLVKHFPG